MDQELNENQIDRIVNEGTPFQTTDYISQAFAIVNKNAGMFIGFTVVYLIISSIVGQIEQLIFGQLNLSILSTLLQAILIPGFFIVARRINQGKTIDFKHFFEGSKKAQNLVGVGILVRLIGLIPVVPVLLSLFMNDNIVEQVVDFYAGLPYGEFNIPVISTISIILFFVAIVGSFYIGVIYFFAMPLALFTTLGVWESMEASRRVASSKFFPILALSLLNMLLIIVGILMIVIGVLYMMPVVIITTYVAFEAMFQLEEREDGIDITDHFVG